VIAYLDWSAFCDAFRVTDEPAAAATDAHRVLRSTIESLSRRRSLAFSPAHVAELARWHPKERALRMARWLDTLNLVWVRAVNPECDDELASWLDIADPAAAGRRYAPFAGHLLAAYASVLGAALHAGRGGSLTIESLIAERDAEPGGVDAHCFSVERFQALHFDRNAAAAMPPEDIHAAMDANLRSLLIRKARSTGRYSEAEACTLVDKILAIPSSIPFNRLAHTLVCNLAMSITAQDASSKAFHDRYQGMSYDLQHLVGGAYCDVFTCDYRVDEALGTAREAQGRSRQLSIRGCGNLEEFVNRLRELCGRTAG
jgi:hypothetical protein